MEKLVKEALRCRCGATAEAWVRETYHPDRTDRKIVSVESPFQILQNSSLTCNRCGVAVEDAQ